MKKKRQRSFGKKSRKAKQQQKRQQEPKQAVRDEQATIPIIPSNSTNATTSANYRTSEALSDRNGNLRLAEGAFNWSAAVDVLGQQLLQRFIAKILESRPSFHISGELISNQKLLVIKLLHGQQQLPIKSLDNKAKFLYNIEARVRGILQQIAKANTKTTFEKQANIRSLEYLQSSKEKTGNLKKKLVIIIEHFKMDTNSN